MASTVPELPLHVSRLMTNEDPAFPEHVGPFRSGHVNRDGQYHTSEAEPKISRRCAVA